MHIDVDGKSVYYYGGGRAFDPALPAVVLIHGAGHDHSVWNFQARNLAYHGFSVIVPDLPGHGRSDGPPLPDIASLAGWLVALLDALAIPQAALAGHSMGSLIALQAAAQAPARVGKLVLVGSVAPMPVAPVLLNAATERRDDAHAMINQWSYAPSSQLGASATPGIWLTGVNRRLMARQAEQVLANDLAACNAYQGGLAAAATLACPTLMVAGQRDQMTPARASRPLFEALAGAPGGARMITLPGAGHAMMAETPDALSMAIRGFLSEKQ